MRTFAALGVRNYRLYFIAQAVSMPGTWMQRIAQSWLVLQLTDSSMALGIVTACQFTPLLLGGLWAGSLADRMDSRRLLLITQTAMGLLALALGLLVVTDVVELWMIYLSAFLVGCAAAADTPTRHVFVHDMVGRETLPNAVALNSTVVHTSRMIGPAFAGIVIATLGMAVAFFINAMSFLAVLLALVLMRPQDLHPHPRTRGPHSVRLGLAYVRGERHLVHVLVLAAVVSVFAMNFNVTLALLARFAFGQDAGAYGIMSSVLAVGSVVGALAVGSRLQPSKALVANAALALGGFMAVLSAVPTLALVYVVLVPIGLCSALFLAACNSLLQLGSRDDMRGRVMALFSVLAFGSKPVGGALVGAAGEISARTAVMVGAVPTILAGAVFVALARRDSREGLDTTDGAVTDAELPRAPIARPSPPRHGGGRDRIAVPANNEDQLP